jgi:hypothetical protein
VKKIQHCFVLSNGTLAYKVAWVGGGTANLQTHHFPPTAKAMLKEFDTTDAKAHLKRITERDRIAALLTKWRTKY